jgi:uncharacterized protein
MEAKRVEGKTYTLFGDGSSTGAFYERITHIVDALTLIVPDQRILLSRIQRASKNLQNFKSWKESVWTLSEDLSRLDVYTRNTNNHLEIIKFRKLFDKTLRTKEWQYHLYMLEAEITNRLNIKAFLDCEYKMALLPYCLHDLENECKSSSDGIEFVCRSCSSQCYINEITKTLKEYDVKGYLWMQSKLKTLFTSLAKDHKTIGVLGIACIPELVNGMRACSKHNIPAVGIPLDANRCIRWMGAFHENSVNLDQLKKLLTK